MKHSLKNKARNYRVKLRYSSVLVLLLLACNGHTTNVKQHIEAAPMGPLTIHQNNPRYFATPDGRALVLAGSHTWDNLQDWGSTPEFDFTGYLNLLEQYNHNVTRLWHWESSGKVAPVVYARTGPGVAVDDLPRFDLTRFNEVYFTRLRERVSRLQDRGIYAVVVLFSRFVNWEHHPFNANNNINGIDGGDEPAFHSTKDKAIWELQVSYVRKVIDAVNEFDNVLFEIGTELDRTSLAWQKRMIKVVRQREADLPNQHLIGLSTSGARNGIPVKALLNSNADWVAPRNESGFDYTKSPKVASGEHVIVADTDHIGVVLGNTNPNFMRRWVIKTFMRGNHILLMDAIQNPIPGRETEPLEDWNDPNNPGLPAARQAMGTVLRLASRFDLGLLTPISDRALCSTTYCLRDPGQAYVAYNPKGRVFHLQLEAASYDLQWIDTAGAILNTSSVKVAAPVRHKFKSPKTSTGDVFLILIRRG